MGPAIAACVLALHVSWLAASLPGATSSMPLNQQPQTVQGWASSTPFTTETSNLYSGMDAERGRYKVMHSLWWHAHRFYTILRPEQVSASTALANVRLTLCLSNSSAAWSIIRISPSRCCACWCACLLMEQAAVKRAIDNELSVNNELTRLPVASLPGDGVTQSLARSVQHVQG